MTFMMSDIALKVCCPVKWTGITGIEPLELKLSKELPPRRKPPLRPVKAALLEDAHTEFDRLGTYMYVKSDSPIASALVIAPKPTPTVVWGLCLDK
jgi:hypothetical protein